MKLGLTLEGGASRSYFSVGVMDVLLRENIMADVVVGSSAGIANAVSYVSRQIGRSLEIGLKYVPDKRYMGLHHLVNPKNKSYYNLPFVFDQLPNEYLPFDYEAYRSFPGEVIAAVTELKTAKTEYLTVPGDDPGWQVLRASCALPLVFPVISLEGKQYMDGGISDPIPVGEAIRRGCDKNIVVLTRERSYEKQKERGAGVAGAVLRRYPAFRALLSRRAEEYNIAHGKILELERQGKVFLLEPKDTTGWGRLERDPAKIQHFYDCGVECAEQRLSALKHYLEESNT